MLSLLIFVMSYLRQFAYKCAKNYCIVLISFAVSRT